MISLPTLPSSGPSDVSADVSPDFRPDRLSAGVLARCVRHEGTPRAVRVFSNECHKLDDYHYWFGLSTLWVRYSGWTDLGLWRRLFCANRPGRETGLMKPSELRVLGELRAACQADGEPLTVYRAHRQGETDWLSYTLDMGIAARFARERGVSEFAVYTIKPGDVLALFTRRGEWEVLALDTGLARRVNTVRVVVTEERNRDE